MFKKQNRIFLITASTFLLLSIIGYVIFNIRSSRYREVNIASQAKVSVFQTDTGAGGKGPESIIDNREDTWWYGYTDEEHPNWIVLSWKEPKRIDKITINFGGDRYALDYKLQVWDGVLWRDIVVVNDNQSDQVTHILPEEIKAPISEMRLYVTSTFQPDNLLRVSEFYVYEKHPKSLLSLDILVYLGYIALLLLTLFGVFKFIPQSLKKILGLKYERILIFIFGVILVIAILLIFFNTAKQKYIYVNVAPEATVSAKQTESVASFSQKQGGSCLSVIDDNERSWWYGHISVQDPNWVVLKWDKVREIDRIKIIFGQSRYAIDYEIQVWNGASWENRTIVTNNNSDLKIHSFPGKDRIKTTRIRFYLTKTYQPDNIQRISEIYIYKKVSASFFTVFLTNAIQPTKDLLSRIGYSFGFSILFFVPGYVLLTLRPFSFFNSEEKFVLSFGITILITFIISLLSLAIKSLIPIYFLAVGVILSISLFVKKKMYLKLKDTEKTIILILVLALFFLTVYLFLIDSTFGCQYGDDYNFQYGVAKIFMHKVTHYATHLDFALSYYQIGLRTILLGMVSIPFLHLFGDRFIVYQSLSSISAVLFFTSLFLLIQRLFNKKTAIISAFFMIIAPYFLFMALLCQVRWFICYFLFLYFYFLMHKTLNFRTKYLLAGTSAALAFMTHPASTPFILGGMGYVALERNQIKRKVLNLRYLILSLAIFIVPWVIWCKVTGQEGSYYLSFLHTKTEDWDTPVSELLSNFLNMPLLVLLKNKLWNLAAVFLYNPRYQNIQLAEDYFKQFTYWTLPGAVSIPLFLFAFWGLVRYFRKYKLEILSFTIIPLVGVLLYATRDAPCITVQLTPLIPFTTAMGIYLLWKIKGRILILLIYFFCLFKHLFLIWKYGYYDLYRWASEYKNNYDLFKSILHGNIYSILGFSSLILWYLLAVILFFYCLKEGQREPCIAEE